MYVPIYLCTRLSICLPVYLATYLPIHILSARLSICLSTSLCLKFEAPVCQSAYTRRPRPLNSCGVELCRYSVGNSVPSELA